MNHLLSRAGLATLVVAASACEPGRNPVANTAPARRYNVLLVVVDTLRADHLGCYGYGRDTSPFLDEFAASAVVFEHCLTQWPKTGPSMAALFSSTYGSQSGVARNTGKWPVPEFYDMSAEMFRDAHYQTMATVSNGSLMANLNYDQGFDSYYEDFTVDTEAAAKISQRVLDWMEQRDRARPYFVWAHYIDPHSPYTPPEGYVEKFTGDEVWEQDTRDPVAVETLENAAGTSLPRRPSGIGWIPRHCYVEGKVRPRDYVALYDAEIRYFDDTFRSMMTSLRADGHLDDTIVIFTSDHGESLGGHNYYFEHGRYPFDDCTHVPLIVHHPDWAARRVDTPVAHIDLMPTIYASLGLGQPRQSQGSSLLAFLEEDAFPDAPDPVFTESGYAQKFSIALRLGRWKLIATPDRILERELGSTFHLFDVETDPGETRNLALDEPDVMRSMTPLLRRFQGEAYARDASPDNGKLAFDIDTEVATMLRIMGYDGESADSEEHEHPSAPDGGPEPAEKAR